MNGISFPIIHPAFEKLKNSGRLLHLIAGLLLIGHAFSHLGEFFNAVYFWCQLIFGIDILLLVFIGRNLAVTMPSINSIFRVAEFFFFLGIGVVLLTEIKWAQGGFHLLLAGVYIYLFHCERRIIKTESISFHHTGVGIPGLLETKFLLWTHINQLRANYHSIEIETSRRQAFKFNFRSSLTFDELDQIHDFCRHYLGKVDR